MSWVEGSAKLREKIMGVRCTTPVRLASLREESTFPFVIGTLGEVFGEIRCLCTTRDQNWTRDAPVAMIPCDGRCVLWHKWLVCFESLSVCHRFENGFNFSVQEQSSYVSQLAGKFASNT